MQSYITEHFTPLDSLLSPTKAMEVSTALNMQFISLALALLGAGCAAGVVGEKIRAIKNIDKPLTKKEIAAIIQSEKGIIQYRNPKTEKTMLDSLDRLRARTTPNQGLKDTFGVDYAFTTDNTETANAFKLEAKDKLPKALTLTHEDDNTAEGDW